jgi:hypothetical protein
VQGILQILGGLCLFVLAAMVVGLLVLRLKFRKLKEDLESATPGAIPRTLNLLPRTMVAWSDAQTAQIHEDDFLLHGFQSDGIFEAAEMPGLFIHGFVHPGRSLFGALYDHPAAGLVFDVVQKTLDGRGLTVTNTAQGGEMDTMPGKVSVRIDGGDVGQVMQAWEENRLEGPYVPAEPGTFKEVFENSYRDTMTWRATRGGATAEEIRRVALARGKTLDAAKEELVLEAQRREANSHLHSILETKFLAESGVTALEWEEIQDRLTIIHDNLLRVEVQECLSIAMEAEDDQDFSGDEKEEGLGFEVPDMPARDAFAAVNATFSPNREFTMRWQCEEPVAADFYLAPLD